MIIIEFLIDWLNTPNDASTSIYSTVLHAIVLFVQIWANVFRSVELITIMVIALTLS